MERTSIFKPLYPSTMLCELQGARTAEATLAFVRQHTTDQGRAAPSFRTRSDAFRGYPEPGVKMCDSTDARNTVLNFTNFFDTVTSAAKADGSGNPRVSPSETNQKERAISSPSRGPTNWPGPATALGTVAKPHSYSRTQKNCVKLCHRWTIGNFTFFLNEGFVLSPPFTADKNDGIHWCLGLCPKGCDDDSKDHISLALCLSSSKERDVLVKYDFLLVSAENEAVLLDSMEEPVKLKQGENWGSKKLIRRDALYKHNLIHDDELTVHCELWYATDTLRLLGTEPL